MSTAQPSQTIDENDFFRQSTLRICGSLNIDKSMEEFRLYLENFMPADAICLSLYDQTNNTGYLAAKCGKKSLLPNTDVIKFPKTFWNDFVLECKRKPETDIINDVDNYRPVVRTALRFVWNNSTNFSMLSMDLELDSERIGFFKILAENKNRYRDSDKELLAMLHEPFAIAMANGIKHKELIQSKELLSDDNRYLQDQLMHCPGDTIIGANRGLRSVMQMVKQVAPMTSPVLLTGETGAGKEVVAETIHANSQLRSGPFIKVNCGAIPESLIDSELFGHEKGSFTGASSRHRGRFERASGGTIFLDEVGELPMQAQIRLLRVLQSKEVERVGGDTPIQISVRVISATNRDLHAMVKEGSFREDLLFRLDVFPIHIPPLRDRKEDIPELTDFFIEKFCREMKVGRPDGIPQSASERLLNYGWPGNVRELQNVVERELIINKGGYLTFEGLGSKRAGRESALNIDEAGVKSLEATIISAIKEALEVCSGKIEGPGGAAELLKINPSTLRSKIRKYDILFEK